MFKNMTKVGISALLMASIFFSPFGSVKIAQACAAPAILTLSLIVSSFASYLGFRGPHLYRYRLKPYPAEVRSGPHYIDPPIDAYYFVDCQGRVWIGDEKTESWILQPQK